LVVPCGVRQLGAESPFAAARPLSGRVQVTKGKFEKCL